MTVSPYIDPKRRKPAGIKVDRIAPGSIAASYGVQQGDILKSINGNPVNTKEQAIDWVKGNPNLPEYVVVFERLGKEFTKTYRPPPRRNR